MSYGLALASASSRVMWATKTGDGAKFGFAREKIEPRESGLREDAIEPKTTGNLLLGNEAKSGSRRCLADDDNECKWERAIGGVGRAVVRNKPRS
jgi:hypothetical protein